MLIHLMVEWFEWVGACGPSHRRHVCMRHVLVPEAKVSFGQLINVQEAEGTVNNVTPPGVISINNG